MVFSLNRSSKYPIEEIIKDYASGDSFTKLHKKYGISMSYAWEIIRKKLGKKNQNRWFNVRKYRQRCHKEAVKKENQK